MRRFVVAHEINQPEVANEIRVGIEPEPRIGETRPPRVQLDELLRRPALFGVPPEHVFVGQEGDVPRPERVETET